MAKKNNDGYLSAKESRRISKANRRITNQLEKQHKRKKEAFCTLKSIELAP